MTQPPVLIFQTDGTNCDKETAHAFRLAGSDPRIVHVNQLREGTDFLNNYAILAIPGGFSYGDDIGAGVILANELISFLRDQLQAFVDAGRLIIGICNGFQVLTRTGLLPFRTIGKPQVALVANDSDRFECRWIKLSLAYETPCVFLQGIHGVFDLPVAHAEGKFVTNETNLREMHKHRLAPLRYHQSNPNGSLDDIAGACDKTGRVLGLMPHPERYVEETQHPNWRRSKNGKPHGLIFFENAVNFVRN